MCLILLLLLFFFIIIVNISVYSLQVGLYSFSFKC